MVKIPATAEGVPAIERCIADGLNINVTLIFSLERYDQVMEAYIGGLEKRAAAKKPIDRIASVASFFVSRVDCGRRQAARDQDRRERPRPAGAAAASSLGKAAIANAKLAYAAFRKKFGAERFAALAAEGRAPAAAALGQHVHQEPGLSRHLLRRGAGRARHRRHHAARDHRRLQGSRQAGAPPRGRPGRRRRRPAAHRGRRHQHGRRHAEARGRRRRVVRQVVRDADRRRRGVARGACCSPTSRWRSSARPSARSRPRSPRWTRPSSPSGSGSRTRRSGRPTTPRTRPRSRSAWAGSTSST